MSGDNRIRRQPVARTGWTDPAGVGPELVSGSGDRERHLRIIRTECATLCHDRRHWPAPGVVRGRWAASRRSSWRRPKVRVTSTPTIPSTACGSQRTLGMLGANPKTAGRRVPDGQSTGRTDDHARSFQVDSEEFSEGCPSSSRADQRSDGGFRGPCRRRPLTAQLVAVAGGRRRWGVRARFEPLTGSPRLTHHPRRRAALPGDRRAPYSWEDCPWLGQFAQSRRSQW
jgi:hypothetical protein